jgi:hypothetical protein
MGRLSVYSLMFLSVILLAGCGGKFKYTQKIGRFDYRDKRTYATIRTAGAAQIRATNGRRIIVGGDYFLSGRLRGVTLWR